MRISDGVLLLAICSLIGAVVPTIVFALGMRRIRSLGVYPAATVNDQPNVSIVIPARNEESKIREALSSVLHLDYVNYEVIVVDDRSTDRTNRILDEVAATSNRLKIVKIESLPRGWLGKNHALEVGASCATGDLILFTDADVIYESTALARAVTYMKEHRLDHLVVGPTVRSKGFFLDSLLLLFTFHFLAHQRPWKAIDPKSQASIGAGAFSLFRASAFRAAGGMRPIALAIADDLQLGQLLKRNGNRQDFVSAQDYLSLEWYSSARDMVRGLTKNFFAVLQFSVFRVTAVTAAMTVCYLGPPIGALAATGVARQLFALATLFTLISYLVAAFYFKRRILSALGYPVAALGLIYMIWRSALLTLRDGGVWWRDTFYPLEALRAPLSGSEPAALS